MSCSHFVVVVVSDVCHMPTHVIPFETDPRGPFYWNISILFSTRIRNHLHYEVWVEIRYSFPNFNNATVEVLEWISNSSHILLDMWLLIHLRSKVNPC